MKTNRDKLPVKYALEIYQEIDGYPTHIDLIYILIRTLEENNLINIEFSPENVWVDLKKCIGTLPKLHDFLQNLTEGNDPILNSIKTDTTIKYLLIRNPWM